jgi:hypothetical protein
MVISVESTWGQVHVADDNQRWITVAGAASVVDPHVSLGTPTKRARLALRWL